MQEALFPTIPQNIYTVAQLTREIKGLIEGHFPSVWVVGEVSNFRAHSSGHFYFTLKDGEAQLPAVMFRGANRFLKFKPEDGMEVIANGRVSVYEARGNYQVIVESLEPKGIGALQLAYDQLKKQLEAEGLFDSVRKRPLPFLPQTVGIVTSPTGAVIRDIIHILGRRAPQVHILLFPVNVQGETAAPEIAAAIEQVNRHGEAEVLIVGRGGGSLEDLWAFNTEVVARAIFSSKIPVISAVGHETDFTIADFVADLRAPTPSAAAELAVPVTRDLLASLKDQQRKIHRLMIQALEARRQNLKFCVSHLKHPRKLLEEWAQRLDGLFTGLEARIQHLLKDRRGYFLQLSGRLDALSPLAVLSRGYSIVRKMLSDGSEGPVVKDAAQVSPGDPLGITLRQGRLRAEVKGR